MVKPINEFGGWLRFIEFTFYWGLVLSPLILAYFIILNPSFLFHEWYVVVLFPGMIYFYYRLVRAVRLQHTATPNYIIRLLFGLLFLLVIVNIIEAIINRQMPDFLDTLTDTLYYIVQVLYFHKSRRVKAYYGSSATKYY